MIRKPAIYRRRHGPFLVSTDPRLLQRDFIVAALRRTYWAGGRKPAAIRSSLTQSVCFGLYDTRSGRQIGFARLITDYCTFSWLGDVVVDESHRGRGLGTWMMASVLSHPCARKWLCVLATRDAHGLYEKFGFRRSEMMRRPLPAWR